MLHDLFRRHDFRGKSPQEVEALLGPATYHHSSPTEYFGYFLSYPGNMLSFKTLEFEVKDGRVVRWQPDIH